MSQLRTSTISIHGGGKSEDAGQLRYGLGCTLKTVAREMGAAYATAG